MHVYFADRLPLPRHALAAALFAVALGAGARVMHDQTSGLLARDVICGAWSLLNVFVLLRLMDSLKDYEGDKVDFPERPLPAGRVTLRDVRITLVLFCLALPGVNLAAGPWAALTAGGVVGYLLLMFRWFFLPDLISNDRLLAIATHHPIYPLTFLHLAGLFALEHGLAPGALRWEVLGPFVIVLWLPFLAWEIARKIRAPEQETRYETYSSRLGPRGAVIFSLTVEGVAVAISVYLGGRLELGALYWALPALGWGTSLVGHLRYLARPCPETARLEVYGQAFALSVVLAQLLAFVPLHWPPA
jgi:4-hydroxybenzoate polyprenyltransferase